MLLRANRIKRGKGGPKRSSPKYSARLIAHSVVVSSVLRSFSHPLPSPDRFCPLHKPPPPKLNRLTKGAERLSARHLDPKRSRANPRQIVRRCVRACDLFSMATRAGRRVSVLRSREVNRRIKLRSDRRMHPAGIDENRDTARQHGKSEDGRNRGRETVGGRG